MIKMFIGLRVKFPLLLSDFNETWIFRQIFEKHSNIKLYESPSADLFHTGRPKKKIIVAFRYFANTPKKWKGKIKDKIKINFNVIALFLYP